MRMCSLIRMCSPLLELGDRRHHSIGSTPWKLLHTFVFTTILCYILYYIHSTYSIRGGGCMYVCLHTAYYHTLLHTLLHTFYIQHTRRRMHVRMSAYSILPYFATYFATYILHTAYEEEDACTYVCIQHTTILCYILCYIHSTYSIGNTCSKVLYV